LKDKKHPASDLPVNQIETLSEPLLTEEGFLNEACMRQFERWVKSMPETYDRLATDPEWSRRAWTTLDEIVGFLAKWAVEAFQGVPPRFDDVINFTRVSLQRSAFPEKIGGLHMKELSLCEINRLLWKMLGDLEAFNAWNDKKKVGENWMDLSALLHNVCISIRNSRRHHYAFNLSFEKEYGSSGEEP
jgi:hypothetical protein